MLKNGREHISVRLGDCLDVMRQLDAKSVDLAYLDPPFFTQRIQRLTTRDRKREFSFSDLWDSHREYAQFLQLRVLEVYRVLSDRGAVFFHCDRNATHVVRLLLEEVFGADGFRSEIIWTYRRWSNSQRALLPAHQTIYYFTKTGEFTFNTIWDEYSPSTNVDQILQERARDEYGKAVYRRDGNGRVVTNGAKRGVPLSDVWDIPYLNPKAKERSGYPTQKPLLLIERIIEIASNEGDVVLDPFCGSGTTLVACQLMRRPAIGIDISEDAVRLTEGRLREPIRSESRLLRDGRETYRQADERLLSVLRGLEYIPVHRNKGIDAFVKLDKNGAPIPVRVQRDGESLIDAASTLLEAGRSKAAQTMFLVATATAESTLFEIQIPSEVVLIPSAGLQIKDRVFKGVW
jgi:site-specific DNA-methyltransferase (adenine-specific)